MKSRKRGRALQRRNLFLGALLALMALGMYFGIFVKMS